MSEHKCKNIYKATITYNAALRTAGMKRNYLMRFEIEGKVQINPGHFLEINFEYDDLQPTILDDNTLKTKELPKHFGLIEPYALISRPISVCNVYHKQHSTEISIIYKTVGIWTSKLAKSQQGDKLKIVGPLGGSVFPILSSYDICVLVAGGVGLPPLLFLAEELSRCGNFKKIYLLVGSASREELPLPYTDDMKKIREFAVLSSPNVELIIATDDGSEGEQGFVTDLAEQILSQHKGEKSIFYSCGPKIMMKKVSELSAKNSSPCYVSLEERMACGVGACQSCVINIKSDNSQNKYALCCSEGPVFSADIIDWTRELER